MHCWWYFPKIKKIIKDKFIFERPDRRKLIFPSSMENTFLAFDKNNQNSTLPNHYQICILNKNSFVT